MSQSDADDDGDENLMMMSILRKMENEVEHVLNFRDLMLVRKLVRQDRIKGHRDLYADYFKAKPAYHEGFFGVAS